MDRYHVQLEWIGGAPGLAGLAAATSAARDVDPDAPTLGPLGFFGLWPGKLSPLDVLPALDRVHPCRVRVALATKATMRHDVPAGEMCLDKPWHYSRPLFRREGLDIRAQRHGSFRVVADDGTTVEISVKPRETLGFLVKDIPGAYARAAK